MRSLQPRLPMMPEDAEMLSAELAVARENGELVFYTASGPVFSGSVSDRLSLRVIAANFVDLGLAPVGRLARAIGVHRATLFRSCRECASGGAAALEDKRRGPSGPHKLKGELLAEAQRLLDAGESIYSVARKIGLSRSAVTYAVSQGRLRRPSKGKGGGVSSGSGEAPDKGEEPCEQDAVQPSSATERSAEDAGCGMGVGTKRVVERVLASRGKIDEAAPRILPAEAVRFGGAMIALPALLHTGLLEEGAAVYGRLAQGFYGLRSLLLLLAFMALLRIRTPEQLTEHAPGELGYLLGLDRVPEVKTVRRKLAEMGERSQGAEFAARLTRRWAADDPAVMGLLYIDGHVRAYHGRKHKVAKTYVPRRRQCMPATTDMWVNDAMGQPWLSVPSPANEGLLTVVDRDILPVAKAECVGHERIMVCFDREGWSPALFRRWHADGIDVLTYRKGACEPWPEAEFSLVEVQRRRDAVPYKLASRRVDLQPGFTVTEVRRLCDNGHQTAIICTRDGLAPATIASQMFARWTQENFFNYGRREYGLDLVASYSVSPADPTRLVSNPEHKELSRRITEVDRELKAVHHQLGEQCVARPHRAPEDPGHAELVTRAAALEGDLQALRDKRRSVPKKVPLAQSASHRDIVQLEQERKRITDAIKTAAYRAESVLAEILAGFYARDLDEAHKFLRAVFRSPADVLPAPDGRTVTIRIHGQANPRADRALVALCDVLNDAACCFPGTNTVMVFESISVASNSG